jgi:hypothetical protein
MLRKSLIYLLPSSQYYYAGQTVSGLGDISITCNANFQTITLNMKETVECIAASCDVSNWEAEKKLLLDQRIEEAKAIAGAEGMACTIRSAGKVNGVGSVLVFTVTSAVAILSLF